MAQAYPLVEFGVLFRPDKEGQPRYASTAWVESLAAAVATCNNSHNNNNDSSSQQHNNRIGMMKLAAHFCGTRGNEVLDGNGDFVQQVIDWGFSRIQINATAVNGVDTSRLAEQVPNVVTLAKRFSQVEFIIQKNEETKPLWQGLLGCKDSTGESSTMPKNISMLVDESKGTGQVATKSWPTPPPLSSSPCYEIGYAGGIGPNNIHKVLKDVVKAGSGRAIWIDMESSLRSVKDGKDVFDLDKCYTVIDAVCQQGLTTHPPFLIEKKKQSLPV